MKDDEFDQILRAIRYQGGGSLSKLTYQDSYQNLLKLGAKVHLVKEKVFVPTSYAVFLD